MEKAVPETKSIIEGDGKKALTPATVRWYHWLIFVSIDVLGPFTGMAITPWLPQIAEDLNCSATGAMLTLQVCIYAKAFGQISLGALSDRVGRRTVILFTFAIYTVSLIFESFVWALWPFLVLRAIDGYCEATALIPVAIARDIWDDEKERASSLSMLIGLRPVALMAAPAVGGILGEFIGWRGLFRFEACLAFVTLCAVIFFLPETLRSPEAGDTPPVSFGSGVKTLLTSRLYMGLTGFLVTQFILLTSMSVVASFIFEEYYGFEPWAAGAVQILPSMAAVLGGVLYKVWATCLPNMEIVTSLRWFLIPHVFIALAFVLASLLHLYEYGWGVFTGIVAAFCMLSILQGPPARSLRIQPFGHLSGLAVGLGGALEQLIPVSVSFIVTMTYDGTPRMTLLVMGISAFVGAAFFSVMLGLKGPPLGQAPALEESMGQSLQPIQGDSQAPESMTSPSLMAGGEVARRRQSSISM